MIGGSDVRGVLSDRGDYDVDHFRFFFLATIVFQPNISKVYS